MQKEAATQVAEDMEIKQENTTTTASDPGPTELLQTGWGIWNPPSRVPVFLWEGSPSLN